MLQQPAPCHFPADIPTVIREGDTDDLLVNANGRTQIRFTDIHLGGGRFVHQVTITHNAKVHTFTPRGDYMMAIVAAIGACVRLGYLRRPTATLRRYHLQHVSAKTGNGVLTYQIGCACGPECRVHRPLLYISRSPTGRTVAHCLGKATAGRNDFMVARWMVEQLVAKHYLR